MRGSYSPAEATDIAFTEIEAAIGLEVPEVDAITGVADAYGISRDALTTLWFHHKSEPQLALI